MNRRNFGFTLVELLVSIAIITMLAGVLSPTFARAKMAAASTHSVTNLRQILVAWHLYSDSYEDICMPPRSWISGATFSYWWASVDGSGVQIAEEGLLYPFTKGAGVQADPLWKNRLRGATGFTGYAYNYRYLGTGSVGQSMIGAPTATVAFATSARISYTATRQIEGNTYLDSPSQNYPTFHARANGRGVIGWADGHVSVRAPVLRTAKFGAFTPEPFAASLLGEIDQDGDLSTDELFDLVGD